MSVYQVDARDTVRLIASRGRKGVVEVEVIPRIRFAKSLATLSTLCLEDDIDEGDTLVAIGQTLATAKRG